MLHHPAKRGGGAHGPLAVFLLITFATKPVVTGQTVSVAPRPGEVVNQVEQTGTAAETERVIVTGSNIPTAGEVGPNPVLTIDRDYIDKSGERTTEAALKDLSVAGPQGVPSFNGGTSAAPGASSISLRGFDPSDTLVLIDGRRVAPYPLGGGSGTQSFVDLNSIPGSAIESIEILKDSASAIYGADAVAGVVNIKLRHDYRGVEARTEYGNTLDKDSGEYAGSLIFGAGDGSTEVSGVLNFYHRNSIFNRDRAFSANVPFPLLSTSSSPFNLQIDRAAAEAAAGRPITEVPSFDSKGRPINTFFAHAPFFTNGAAPASDYVYSIGRTSRYNFNLSADSFPESERYGGFVRADHKICGDQLAVYADMFYQNAKTHYELAPTPTGVFEQPGKTILAIPPHSPGPTLGGPSYQETGIPLGAFNPFNPFQQIVSGNSRGRLAEFGNRLLDNQTDAFFTTLGVKGDKLFDGNWGYDADFRYSQVMNTSVAKETSASRFNRILNAADPIFDPASPQFIGTTVPYNPFGDYRVPIASNAQSINFATIHPKEIDVEKLATFDVNIYTTQLFALPAGGVGLAFGGQFRREALRQQPDDLSLLGDILGAPRGTLANAGRKTYALYAETDLPVFSSTFSVPGFHALSFTAAARYEEFRSNDSNVLVPKVGIRWQPFDDSFTIRATWGEGFHEPSLIELFGTPSQFLANSFRGLFSNETPVTIRSNPNLQPEDSRAFTGGFVFTPKFFRGLNITIDLFDIESKGRVNSNIAPDDIVLRALQGRSLFGEKVNRDSNGDITSIEGAFQNGGSQKARGADFTLQYQLPTRFGVLTSLTQATYLDSFEFAPTPDVPEQQLRGSASPFAGLPSAEAYFKWKGNSRLDWKWKNVDLATTVYYRDGFHEIVAIAPIFPDDKLEHWVHQTWFFDAQLSYEFRFVPIVESTPVAGYSKSSDGAAAGASNRPSDDTTGRTGEWGLPIWKRIVDGTTVTIGCNDIFGQDPPRSQGNYPAFAYDPTGRFVYLALTRKF